MRSPELSRRAVLVAACGTCVTAAAGCTTYTTGQATPTPADGADGPAPAPEPAPAGIAAADIPVGSGKIFADQDVVIAQPTAGTFVAFSAACTHQGCAVTAIEGKNVTCPCHGSAFALADGSVVTGPATRPLAEKQITVADGQITLA